MIGSTFAGRYQIESLLGQGGMGAVYRAHDQVLDRGVAVKVLSKAGIGSEGRGRLLCEAQAAAQLNHPNIVAIYDAGEADRTAYIVMELVEGHSLHERPPASLDLILDVISQVCLALEHAHTRGIIHRDLKPENVLLTLSGQAKLMDFGLARSVASRLTNEGSISGSVFYLAPELALGQDYDARADLYALGVMLYELCAGELPFTAGDPLAVISQHLHAPVTPPRARKESIPPALDDLILRLLSKRPDDRPASARDVYHAIERIEAGETGVELSSERSLLDGIVRGRLVGRAKELADAARIWDAARSGKSSVLLISGEPGIGKTRLAWELAAQAQMRGAILLKGDCYMEGGAPYAPLAQMIETAAGLVPLEQFSGSAEILSLAPGLRLKFPQLSSTAGLQVEQQQAFESLAGLFTSLCTQAPVLVFLEDAHWADSGTLAFLRHLARRAARLNLRLMILLTYREFELEEGRSLNQVLYDFQHERLSERIKLSRLPMEETENLLTALLSEAVDCDFLEHVHRETEGNPFFIEEVCKALIEAGDLYRQDGRWHWPAMAEIEIPQSIKVAIQARAARLSPEAQETLRIAAVFGREFDFNDLQAVSDLSEDQLLEALESAERAQLITPLLRPGKLRAAVTSFAFSHALMASTLRESLSSLRRQRLHQKAGLALERLHPERLDELAPQLGRHFAEAGLPEKAVDYLLRAGDSARQVFAYPEAIDYYQNALLILKDQGDFERASHTLMKLGLLYHSTSDFERSRQAYQEGFNLWRQTGETQNESIQPASRPLRIANTPPLTFDPGLAFESNSVPFIDQLFVGLVSLTGDLNVVPELAESWEVLENGQKYIFHLRKDVFWTDRTPVTAGDVEFAWKRILSPETKSRNHVYFYDIRGAQEFYEGRLTDPAEIGVRASDPYTLEVELKQPASYFLHLLTYAATFPVPAHVLKAKGSDWTRAENLVTNGPFCLESFRAGESVTLVRNQDYPGRCKGNLQRVEICIRPEMLQFSNRLALYEAGELDAIGFDGLASGSDHARQVHAGEYLSYPNAMVTFLVFRLWKPPFDDVRVRRAFVQSIDREMLAEVVLRGYASPALSGLIPQGLPGHLGERGLAFNPDEARRLLAEAGYPYGKGLPEIEVWYATAGTTTIMEFIQEQWLEHLGVNSRWVAIPANEMYGRLQSKAHPPIFFNGWLADYPDPDTFLRVAIAFQTRWHHPPYEVLIEKARRTANLSVRMNLYHQAERILINEAPLMPLIYSRSHILVHPWLHPILSPIHPLILKDVIMDERE